MEQNKVYSLFNKSGTMQELKDTELPIGQIVWLNGYGQDKYSHERKAIYDSFKSDWNGRLIYKLVNLDTFDLSQKEAYSIDHEDKIFGIGTYFTSGDIADPEEIKTALIKAEEKQKQAQILKAKKEQEAEEIKVKGKKIFDANLPKDAKAIITASLEQNECDSMSDYYGSRTIKTVILAFSKHTRDLFPEMRKAALNCDIPEIKELAEAPKDYEHREKYSMGHGYYLGRDRYSGWQISKSKFSSYTKPEQFYYIAGCKDGFFAFKNKEPKVETMPCQNCGDVLPLNKLYSYVDPNNEAITKNSPDLCKKCYSEAHPDEAYKFNQIEVKHNEEKNGVEIYFPKKPDTSILTDLKSNGWRWSKFNKCWYKRFSQDALNFANSL